MQKKEFHQRFLVLKRLGYTVCLLFFIRLLAFVPLPGVDISLLTTSAPQSEMRQLLDLFSGGGLTRFSLFSLSISPYISASIAMQLMGVMIPRLEEIQQQGEIGRRKIKQYTKAMTLLIAGMSGWGVTKGFVASGVIPRDNLSILVSLLSLVAGTQVLIWLGGEITEKGVGNGISLILMTNILSHMPRDGFILHEVLIAGHAQETRNALGVVLFVLLIVFLTVRTQNMERRIPLVYPSGLPRQSLAGEEPSALSLKVNPGGVMPVIFTTTFMALPTTVLSLRNSGSDEWMSRPWLKLFQTQEWFRPEELWPTVGFLIYAALLFLFSYLYTKVSFNTTEIAERLKKQQATIAHIRMGKETREELSDIVDGVVLIGATRLLILCAIPLFLTGYLGVPISFGGTSLIIVVSVLTEAIKQIRAIAQAHHYQSFIGE